MKAACALLVLGIGSAHSLAQSYVPNEVLVRLRSDVAGPSFSVAALQGRVVQVHPATSVQRVVLPRRYSVSYALAKLRQDSTVLYAEPNYICKLAQVNDPKFATQWNLAKVAAPAAWGLTTGNPDVLVAVLDTGADLSHPDLLGQIDASANFVGIGSAQDGHGHGTHTAGTVAASTNNGVGIASLGYQTRLLIGKVVTNSGFGTVSSVIQGIEWSIINGAKVISMSFVFSTPSVALEEAVNDAWNQGLVLVAAAGNSASSSKNYPAAFENCIAVAATNQSDARASFSNYGDWVDVAAPGQNILSTFKNGGTAVMSGTSMATPHVAALAALLWGNGGRSNAAIREAIVSSGNSATGFGSHPIRRINARNALLRTP